MVSLRLADMEDFDFFYNLKCEESNIYWTGHGDKPNRENLYVFFKDAVENAHMQGKRKIFIVENEKTEIGHIYIIPDIENNSFEVAPAISEQYQGKGYAKEAIEIGLKIGKERYGFVKMVTSIREDNVASLKAFAKSGVTVLDEYKMVYIPRLGKEVKMYFAEKDLR